MLLTGGSRGLGLVVARQRVQQGARLAICTRDRAELERARVELQQCGGDVLSVPCDVTDRSQVDRMVQQVRDRFGPIDILINNAGTYLVGPMDVLTIEDYDDLMKLHFWAPLYTTYAVFPEMRQRQAGRIVNISSIRGKVVSPHYVAVLRQQICLNRFVVRDADRTGKGRDCGHNGMSGLHPHRRHRPRYVQRSAPQRVYLVQHC